MRIIKNIRKSVKKTSKRTKKQIKKLSKKAKKSTKKVFGKISKSSFDAIVFPLGLSGRVRNALFGELRRMEDMTGVPGVALIASLLTQGLSVNTLMETAETWSKGTKSKRYAVSSSTLKQFKQFIKENPRFPYKKTYSKLRVYYNANNPKGAITFENRVYMKRKPKEGGSLLFHEYVHTFQYYKYGKKVFGSVYAGNYLLNILKGYKQSKAYSKINFEKEAYDWQSKFRQWSSKKSKK